MTSSDPGNELHDRNPAGRFSDRAADYRRHRPDYPAAAIDAILDGLGPPATIAADVGAGTGISSRLLAARGIQVIAVEPNAEMRAAADPHDRVRWHDGTAEHTGLASASVQLVLCAQSFHWFRPRETLAEFHRILAPGGRLALIWNNRDREDALTAGYVEAIHQVNGEDPVELRPFDPEIIAGSGLFSAPVRLRFPHSQRVDRTGLLGRAMSASYVPKTGPAYERLAVLLEELWARHRDASGAVTIRYVTNVYRSQRLEPGAG